MIGSLGLKLKYSIRFEGEGQLPKPEKAKNFNPDNDRYEFVSNEKHNFVTNDGRWTELVVSESGELYREYHKTEIDLDAAFKKVGIDPEEENQQDSVLPIDVTGGLSDLKDICKVTNVDLQRLDDFTGNLEFRHFDPHVDENHDLVTEYRAVIIYGKLDKVEIISSKLVDNTELNEMIKKSSEGAMSRIKTTESWWYPIYSVYSFLVRAIFGTVMFILGVPILILTFIRDKIAPKL